MKKYIFILLSTLTLASCSTYKHSYRLTEVPNNRITVTATVVDVDTDFDRKINATSDKATSSVQDAKANAYFNAIQDNDIDVLVDPIYSIRIKRGLFISSAKAEVSGFAGKFVNPRSLAETLQEAYDAKIKSLEQFLELTSIVNEDKATTIMSNCCGDNGTSNSMTFNGAPALIDQFNSIYGGTAVNLNNDSGDGTATDEGENKSILSNMPILGKIFK